MTHPSRTLVSGHETLAVNLLKHLQVQFSSVVILFRLRQWLPCKWTRNMSHLASLTNVSSHCNEQLLNISVRARSLIKIWDSSLDGGCHPVLLKCHIWEGHYNCPEQAKLAKQAFFRERKPHNIALKIKIHCHNISRLNCLILMRLACCSNFH